MKWHIPTVLMPEELLDTAFRKAAKIRPCNAWERSHPRTTIMKKIGAVSGVIQAKLNTYVKKFPSVNPGEVYQRDENIEGVRRFYYDLFDLTFGIDRMKQSLGALDWAAGKVRELESVHIRKVRRMVDAGQMDAVRMSFYGRVSSIVNQIGDDMHFLAEARDHIRKMPHIEDDAVVVVVAGAPNVGKSSLINLISSGNSEIAPYPFTTRGIFLGHLTIGRSRVVLVDTPGLLERPDSERNPIERKATSAIRNLSSAVIFVLDPSETCGMPVSSQETLVNTLSAELGDIPHIIVENKCDTVRRVQVRGDPGEPASGPGNLCLSCITWEGKDALMGWLEQVVRSR